jgi:hypothetical protein
MAGNMKKWLIGIGIGLLCIVAAVVCFHLYGKAQLAGKIAELKAQGLPTSFAELEEQYKLPEGTPNAADIYMKAFAAYKPLADAEKQNMLPVMGDLNDPNDNEPYPPQQIAVAAEFIGQNQDMFMLLHEAGKVENCYYPMDYSLGFGLKNNILHDIKNAAMSLSLAGLYYSYTNQPQKAYDAAMDNLRLGQSMCSNPGLINHLVRIALLNLGVSGTQEMVNRTSLDESHLLQLQEYLQHVEETTKIGPALIGEICFCLEYKNIGRGETAAVLSADEKAGRYAGALIPQNSAKLIGAYQRMIEIDKLPIQEQLPRVRQIVKEAESASIFIFLPQITLPAIEKVYMSHLRVRAIIDCAITALAIERYRLKEGRLPETMEALVPGYLPQVYLDPFDGKPLRYKRTEPGYMIYTIGPDGR